MSNFKNDFKRVYIFIFTLLISGFAFSAQAQEQPYAQLTEGEDLQTPLLDERRKMIKHALLQKVSIMARPEAELNVMQREAQRIALEDSSFVKNNFISNNGEKTLSEIFGVYPARPSDYTAQTAPLCSDGNCYRVEAYNYAYNFSTVALVNTASKKLLKIGQVPHTQPDIPTALKSIALHIATESAAVQAALGYKPTSESALMADTKTALNRTRCERSKHLCVAPTFVKQNKALWAIVDLTSLKLIGVRWTNVGQPQQAPTERRVQNEHVTACFCKKMNSVERNDWSLNYMLTSSDGLRVSEVTYKGKRIIHSAKLVDWHVSYSNTDGFGYSDAVGCPFFSSAAVVAVNAPKILDLVENEAIVGFVIEQDFFSEGWPTACNYNYKQRFEFYNDGRFRVAAASLGRGCGNNGTYRPVTRIAFAGNNSFAEWSGNDWKPWIKEQWKLQTPSTALAENNTLFRLQNTDNQGFTMQANIGQYADGGRGDQAYVYVTRNKPEVDEGESDLVTIGPCCNTDYQQGPEKFIEPQADNIEQTELVVWYVPQLKNDDTKGREYCWAERFLSDGVFQTKVYPCFSGAMWLPLRP
jgi:hypothetical protein